MAKERYSCGCVGVVTDGGVRDVSDLLKVPFAAHSKGTTVHHGAMRIRAIGQTIEIGGITVKRGDVIHADEGVIKIPTSCLGDLAGSARRMESFEMKPTGNLLQDKNLSSFENTGGSENSCPSMVLVNNQKLGTL